MVLRWLEKEPDRRYQRASAVKSEVERISHLDPKYSPTGEFLGSDLDGLHSKDTTWQVALPAVALVVTGSLGLFLALLSLLGALGFLPHGGGPPNILVVTATFALPFSLTITMGGLAMTRFRGYDLARTASILAILPLHTMWLIGVPAGIWALIVLSRLDTKAAFQVHAVPIWSRVLTWLAGAIVVMCVIFAAAHRPVWVALRCQQADSPESCPHSKRQFRRRRQRSRADGL